MKYYKKYLLLIVFGLSSLSLFAQSAGTNQQSSLADKIENYNKSMPREKLFLHTDKPYYSATDTIWFKAYLLNGLDNTYSPLSGLLYVELIAANSKVVQRISVPVKVGLSWGQLPLDEKSIEGGDYTLRAYTNWMQNFGEDCFFTKHLVITNEQNPGWLITQKQSFTTANGKQAASIDFHLKTMNNQNYSSKKLDWRVEDNGTVLARGSAATAFDGGFKINFNLPEKMNGQPKVIIENTTLTQKAVVPLQMSKPANIDLQFMPEGGYLVAGLRTRVGFKAIAENGLGADIEGKIVDSKNADVMLFKSAYKGMGAFNFVPMAGESYTAKVMLTDGSTKSVALPAVKTSGINLRIINTSQSDSVYVTVNFSADLLKGQAYHLVGMVNNVIYSKADFQASRPRVSTTLAKKLFSSGIVHFTVFNSQDQPLTERMVFVNNHDNLNIAASPSKATYKMRDSIALNIDLKDKSGNPVPASSLSVSVTDNNQVKPDSLENNIVSDVLLTSGLKGTVETPAYYFSDAKTAYDDLDVLLLTQGWTGYNWEDIVKPQTAPLFKPEPQFSLSGTVTSYANKPIAGSKVLAMAGGKLKMMLDTLTDAEGKFSFKNFPKFDTVSFFVQARTHDGKKSNMALEIDEFKPAAIGLKRRLLNDPWYMNTDTTVLKFINNDIAANTRKISLNGNNVLNEVSIEGKKGIRYSQNLNGGDADQTFTEADIASSQEVSLLEFIKKNVKGLYLGVTKNADHKFVIRGRNLNFIVDGLDIRKLYYTTDPSIIPDMKYEDLVTELSNLKIKDVIGVEVMATPRNVSNYNYMYNVDHPAMQDTSAFIEITTRSGKGLVYKTRQNIANYKPIPVNWPKEFYMPRYTAANINSTVLDTRSTIFWQPHLSMSENGKAVTSFYAADKPATYTVIIQGSNMKGLLGYKRFEINIK